MKEAGELYINAIEHWRDAKGKGTALIPYPLNDKVMVLGILQRVYARSPSCNTTIIVESFKERQDIIDFITQREGEEENNEEFKKLIDSKNIKVLTIDFVERIDIKVYPFLTIVYRPDKIGIKLFRYICHSKFVLVVLNQLLQNEQDMTVVYRYAPLLPDFRQKEIEQLRLSTPVEESQISIDIPEDSEDFKLLSYYNEYISTSLAIFGSFDIMNQANYGNSNTNISANQICNRIAYENGWNDNLDMSIEFNLEIDRLYNPMNLKDRASQTYEIIRNRSELLSNYKGKLETILEIVNNNKDKKILIINKRASFANEVTDYINNLSETTICMNYHDKVENIPAYNIDGTPIVYKSGPKKGQIKLMGAKRQKSYAMENFNEGRINVLSTNNAPDKDLNIDVDIVIITSPLCEDISSYIYRLSNLNFCDSKLKLYTLYCRNTQEQQKLENKILMANHNIKNDINVENNYDFVVAD